VSAQQGCGERDRTSVGVPVAADAADRRPWARLREPPRRRAGLEREHGPRLADEQVDPPEIDETWELLAGLPLHQRVVLVLRYYEDLLVDAIAQIVGCRPATVRTRIHRALSKLRKEMTP
jgi:RNA polymerase sigma factor (sigma-70 family)